MADSSKLRRLKRPNADRPTTYTDPGKYDEEREAEIREMIELLSHYAESGPTYDPTGRYVCGSCNMRIPDEGRCTHVDGPVSMRYGGCRKYMRGDPIGKSHALPRKMTQTSASYAERPQVLGFGCYPRCMYGAIAAKPDSQGRTIWCSFWGLHVRPTACCDQNDGPDSVDAPGEAS